ncbi:hypothetical protein HUJ04_007073 [Dendroctonus ponderosae]|nr:hypothetical protein HUJ04_007073 [Dendroctonus ponderosae]
MKNWPCESTSGANRVRERWVYQDKAIVDTRSIEVQLHTIYVKKKEKNNDIKTLIERGYILITFRLATLIVEQLKKPAYLVYGLLWKVQIFKNLTRGYLKKHLNSTSVV